GREVEEMRRLPRMVAETPIDHEVPVKIWRNGHETEIRVTVGELEAAEEAGLAAATPGGPAPAPEEMQGLGLSLTGLTRELRQQFGLSEQVKGVVITEIDAAGPAAEKGLRPGDVIVEVSQEEVASAQDVATRI